MQSTIIDEFQAMREAALNTPLGQVARKESELAAQLEGVRREAAYVASQIDEAARSFDTARLAELLPLRDACAMVLEAAKQKESAFYAERAAIHAEAERVEDAEANERWKYNGERAMALHEARKLKREMTTMRTGGNPLTVQGQGWKADYEAATARLAEMIEQWKFTDYEMTRPDALHTPSKSMGE
jgi:hypothetical protein